MGVSSLVGSLMPLVPFLFLGVFVAACSSVALAGAALFAVGAYEARRTMGPVLRSAFEMTAIGLVSALAAWAIGILFGVK